MSLQPITIVEYEILGSDLKSLKQLNEKVKQQLSKVCGRNYAERVLPCEMDFLNIAHTLEGKMNQEYPESKAESMKVFY